MIASACEKAIASVDPGGGLMIVIEVINAEANDTIDPGGRLTIVVEAIDAEAIDTVDPGD